MLDGLYTNRCRSVMGGRHAISVRVRVFTFLSLALYNLKVENHVECIYQSSRTRGAKPDSGGHRSMNGARAISPPESPDISATIPLSSAKPTAMTNDLANGVQSESQVVFQSAQNSETDHHETFENGKSLMEPNNYISQNRG